MLVLGLTGGIACGKSTVSAWLRDQGAYILDADEFARQAVALGSAGLADVLSAFGPEYQREDGQLDRARLGARVFSQPAALQRLNGILHPRIVAAIRRHLDELAALDPPLVVVDAALLLELDLQPWCDAVLTIELDAPVQLARLQSRNSLSQSDAAARIAAQSTQAFRAARATWVLLNNGTVSQLTHDLEQFWRDLTAKFPGAVAPPITQETQHPVA